MQNGFIKISSIGRQRDRTHHLLRQGESKSAEKWCTCSILRQLNIMVHLIACIGMNFLDWWLIINVTFFSQKFVAVRKKWAHCALRCDISNFNNTPAKSVKFTHGFGNGNFSRHHSHIEKEKNKMENEIS